MKSGKSFCFFGVLLLVILASASAYPSETSVSENKILIVKPKAGPCPNETMSTCDAFCKFAGSTSSKCNLWSSFLEKGFYCGCKKSLPKSLPSPTTFIEAEQTEIDNLVNYEPDTRILPTLCPSSLYQACNEYCDKILNACISTVNSITPSSSSALCTCGLV